MNEETLQKRVNDISAYSQINKAFRHVHGTAAAAVLATIVYKYTYWGNEGQLKSAKTKKGNALQYFHISKLDIALDSGVSISMLEKKEATSPLVLLEKLKMIKQLKLNKANMSDRFVLYPNGIINEIKKVSDLFKEDMEMIKELPRDKKRSFLKALKGKSTRGEVLAKFSEFIEDEELVTDDDSSISTASAPIEEVPAPIEEIPSSNEGRTKNSTKNSILRNTNPTPSYQVGKKELKVKQEEELFNKTADETEITIAMIKKVISVYVSGKATEENVHTILKNYIPNKEGSKWKMSDDDKEYIRINLSGVEPGYMSATLEYIDTNIERMISGVRKMRFGSILAGIREKVIEAGRGYDSSELPRQSKKEYKKEMEAVPEEEDFDFLGQL